MVWLCSDVSRMSGVRVGDSDVEPMDWNVVWGFARPLVGAGAIVVPSSRQVSVRSEGQGRQSQFHVEGHEREGRGLECLQGQGHLAGLLGDVVWSLQD